MVKKSTKSKSKRISLKKKYKIIKKVKEHHRKKAKAAKKLGTKRKKIQKDPGIPNNWPFKEEELRALETRRARAIIELEQKKAAKKEQSQKRRLGLLEGDEISNDEPELASQNVSVATNIRESSERSFHKELVKVIELSDVILEVLDARDPLGTRCHDLEKMVIQSGPDKHLVLLLNKIDLVPRESVIKWLKYLREELPAVAFKCSTQEQRANLGWKKNSLKPANILQTSDCLGASTLVKLLKNYSRSHEIKKSITVGVVGIPNVGKSSLINSLKRCRVVNVGSTPGLTKFMQEIQLDKHVRLLDCPGVVMLRSGEGSLCIALRNCKRIEKLDDPVDPVRELLKLCPAEKLTSLYRIPSFDSVDDFLQRVAAVRGKLKKGGILDVQATARIVLRDWNGGKLPYYTMPPVRNVHDDLETAIVPKLGKEFNVDEIYQEETSYMASLTSIDDFNHVEVPSSDPLSFEENLETAVAMAPTADQPMPSAEAMVAADSAHVSSNGQFDKLYAAEGILDPRWRKAEKKRRKAQKTSEISMMDADYDFKVDYVKDDALNNDIGS